jgi:hypothetical protein
MPLTNFERIKSCAPAVATLRERFEKAKARGQVELHMDMSQVELLLMLSEAVIRAASDPPRATPV